MGRLIRLCALGWAGMAAWIYLGPRFRAPNPVGWTAISGCMVVSAALEAFLWL